MKRFGIVSYNMYCSFTNYGSALQMYANHRILNEISPDIEGIVVDYCPEVLAGRNPLNPYAHMWDQDEESRKQCEMTMPAILENYTKFQTFFSKYYKLSSKKYTKDNFNESLTLENLDGYLCGGDTIFDITEFKGFDDGYYANFDCMKNSHTIAFGASFGDGTFSDSDFDELKKRLMNFKALGVRETTNIEFIKANSAVPVKKVLDPTLLFTQNDYECITAERIIEEPYILLYSRRYNKNMEEYADKLAEKLGCKVVEISLRAVNKDKHTMFYEAGIEEFVSLIKYSEYCVTNSFHGAIFSAIFHKDFNIFTRTGCNKKIDELLETLGLSDRQMVTGNEKRSDSIDFQKMEERLNNFRKESIQFLKKSLGV